MLVSLLNSLIWLFAPDKGAGDGAAGGGSAGDGGDSGNSTTGQNSGDPSPDTAKREIPADWKAMSATDFNERLSKEQRAATRKMLKDMGFGESDFDTPEKLDATLKAAGELMTFARDQRRAQLSAEEQVRADLTTAQETAATERQRREQAEGERDAAQRQLREFILRSAITAAAGGATHPSDVYDLYARVYAKDKLETVIKPETPLFGDDGAFNAAAVDQEVIKAIVDKCREERREWWQGGMLRQTPGSPSNAGSQPHMGSTPKPDKMAAARAIVRR